MALPAVLALPILGLAILKGVGRRRSQTSRRNRRPSPQDRSGTNQRTTARREEPAIPLSNFRVRDHDRIYLNPAGSFSSVGKNWWAAHGKRIFRKAQKIQCDDIVLETAEQAVPNFKWDQDPLPPGAKKLYDNVAVLIRGTEDSEAPEIRDVAPQVPTEPQVAKTRRANRTKTPEQKEAAKAAAKAKREAKKAAATEEPATGADTQLVAAPQEAPHGGDGSSDASVEG